MDEYLSELQILLGRDVMPQELISAQETKNIRTLSEKIERHPIVTNEIMFSDKNSDSFSNFLAALKELNSSPLYVWTPRTITCGTILIKSFDEINWNFKFSVNKEGILVFLTKDCGDKLLLDFWEEENKSQRLKLEIQGYSWSKFKFSFL